MSALIHPLSVEPGSIQERNQACLGLRPVYKSLLDQICTNMIVVDLVRLEFGMVFASVFQHFNDGDDGGFEQLGSWLAFRLLSHLA